VSKVLREKNTFCEEKTLEMVKKERRFWNFCRKKNVDLKYFHFSVFFCENFFGSLVGFKVMFLGTSVV
jgi:hypothetical protein